ncbi:hypothetical protein, partial [Streptomyces sp. NPDC051014]|uniref:hypothetical protein n=1 Tax=Streptomyces sp. NPDC051014 TaxID=3155751 RepID=UPI0033F9AA22
ELGGKLPTTATAAKTATYVRDAANRELMLATAGLTETTIAQHLIPTGQREPLTELDRQLIATLLHHPAMQTPGIAKLYNTHDGTVRSRLAELGRRLGTNYTSSTDTIKYVRIAENRSTVMRLAELTETTIPQYAIHAGQPAPITAVAPPTADVPGSTTPNDEP